MKLATVITSQIANLFQKRGEVEPPALIKALEREIVKHKKNIDGFNVVPNDYTIFLSEEDCHRLSAARVIKSLYEAAAKKVIRENCFMDGILNIKIEKNLNTDDAILILTQCMEDSKIEEDTIDLENDVLSQTLLENGDTTTKETIIADKTKITASMKTFSRTVEHDLAVITDLKNSEVILGERQVYFGRKETNDFVLEDEGASRIHAYISYERHRHVLRDAGSLNGTFVNKKPITRYELKNGDKILIGNTVLVYKVL